MVSVLDVIIRIMTCFLNRSLVVILILGLFASVFLFTMFTISATFLAGYKGKAFSIQRISLTFTDILAFKTYTYDFLLLRGLEIFLLITSFVLIDIDDSARGIGAEGKEVAVNNREEVVIDSKEEVAVGFLAINDKPVLIRLIYHIN